ncbi:membrane protein [Aureimonas sp. SA4125]|uniref:alpha-2-macroglobulin family protein n=1 Tax=Aureimonas sp. SA4125 TaxID=2826993 RepID=UPI001CC67346|nr:alpha-2-macroglobulin family protein [Aureimonas sp. SA4125]BDA83663.1 membrane protein [Aureimonas sp. SA4125]
MRKLFRTRGIGVLLALALAALTGQPALSQSTAERRIVSSPNADYFGGDYDILKDVDANICETACLSDAKCQAFTLNTSTKWCFLKSEIGELRYAQKATSGRVVTAAALTEDQVAEREAELAFLPKEQRDGAAQLRLAVEGEERDAGLDDGAIAAAADTALSGRDFAEASRLYREILKRDASDSEAWKGLALATLAFTSDDYEQKQANDALRAPAAINAYVTAADAVGKASALDLLAQSMAAAEDWASAIKTWRASIAVLDLAETRTRLDAAVASHGFRITDNTVDNNAANPRICVNFSEALAPSLINSETIGNYVSVDGGDSLPVSASGSQVCVEGVTHGARYRMVIRPGILSASGEKTARPSDISVYVRDRDPSVRFASNAYVLPAGGEATIPVTTVNTDTVQARLVRIGDRQLARTIAESRFLGQFASYEVDDIADNQGEQVWKGFVDVARRTNEEVTTAIPVSALVTDLHPGVYLLSANATNAKNDYEALATQWFVLTDIGLSTFSAEDGFHVFARSLGTALPLPGVKLDVVAANNNVLGTVTTDDKGYARLSAGLMRGTGGDRPAVLMASADGASPENTSAAKPEDGAAPGDFVFLDLTATPFDLTDRGVEGRQPAGALDVFLTPERGIYRTGDTAHFTGLMRDGRGEAVEGLTLTGIVTRPDGVEFARQQISGEAAGGFTWETSFPANAMRGAWTFALFTDPKRPALAQQTVLVDDFEPQKIDFDLTVAGEILDPAAPPAASVDVRYLFGAAAAGLEVSGVTILQVAETIDGFSGYHFGLADDEPTAMRIPFSGDVTDEAGHSSLTIEKFEPPVTTKPLKASVQVQVTDAGGRPVEKTVDLPLAGAKPRLGIKRLFDGAVGQGAEAAFDIVALGPDAKRSGLSEVDWVVNKITMNFQWYQSNGRWNYEPTRSVARVASGSLDLSAEAGGKIAVPVEWGGYELVLTDPAGNALPASVAFDAGWYVAATSAETPDILKVSLDKPRYAIGDKAVVHIEPRFAGKVEVLVMDERVITKASADIPAEGGDVTLDVTRDWGPGVYVTAVLYRPMNLVEKRMPGRAIGLVHAAVDPGNRALAVSLKAPAEIEPRRTVDVGLTVAGIAEGETAYVTLAAVDVGILNITSFTPPSPNDFYFGQRRLGVEIRDLYSRLIDRMQGAPGSVRSGGDAGASMVSPPPMDQLVALFSGVVTAGKDGKVSIPVAVPDFNGTLKLMAVAWSKSGVGEASADMLVRDPIVVQVSQPRFLAPGDTSRIAIDVNHVEGPTGKVQLALSGGEGIVRLEANGDSSFELAANGRQRVIVPVTAETVGDAAFELAMTTPDGTVLTKSFLLPVRSLAPETVAKSRFELAANGGRLTLGDDILEGYVPETVRATVSITGLGGFDVAGVVRALDRYPYGCTEQLTSRAMPLVYLDQTILSAGLSGSEDVAERVNAAVKGVLANQSSNGSFGLWRPDSGDLWLDAYVADFLTRARETGYAVPDEGFTLALDNLRNSINYLPEQPDWGPVAYAYYVLARNGRAAIGDLRYYADNEAGNFRTPLAQAHLAAALALYGDRVRSETVFRMAVDGAKADQGQVSSRSDYGTPLRDGAAVLTLGVESKIEGVDFEGLVQRVGIERSEKRFTSTQEDAWSLLAAHALLNSRPPSLTVAGEDREGAFAASYDAGALATPVDFANRGATPVSAEMTLAGVPREAPPAESAGYLIARSYYTLEGEEADPSTVGQGDRLVAVIDVQPGDAEAARLIVDDPLPAGFEIDNPSILRGGDVASLSFLELTDEVAHTEFRADRFIVAVNKAAGDAASMRFAYIVRAVSPGEFVHPAAVVEDMYRPERRGRTDESRVTVVGALQ